MRSSAGGEVELVGKRPEVSDEEHSDRTLVRRTQAGDRDAFERLARRYLRPVHAVAASFLRERADIEDVAQDTFLRALDAIGRFDPTRPFAPWLYEIARNVARNRVKWRKRHPEQSVTVLEESLADGTPSAARTLELAELREHLTGAIDGLPEQRRLVFRLVDVEGYTPAEAAALMGLSSGAVRAHLHLARRDLRRRLEPVIQGREAE